jgi:hypothetical protein
MATAMRVMSDGRAELKSAKRGSVSIRAPMEINPLTSNEPLCSCYIAKLENLQFNYKNHLMKGVHKNPGVFVCGVV